MDIKKKVYGVKCGDVQIVENGVRKENEEVRVVGGDRRLMGRQRNWQGGRAERTKLKRGTGKNFLLLSKTQTLGAQGLKKHLCIVRL